MPGQEVCPQPLQDQLEQMLHSKDVFELVLPPDLCHSAVSPAGLQTPGRGDHRPGAGLANVIMDPVPAALYNTGQYEKNRVECDHGRLKARLRPMRGLRTERTASVAIRGHAFIQNLRRDHYELAVDAGPLFRLPTAFNELRPAS